MKAALRCPVRGCALALARDEKRWFCTTGHSFDLSRSGALNLLQPQDRRSRNPGDTADAAKARQRLAALDIDHTLHLALVAVIAALKGRTFGALLDVGCGEGAFLRAASAALACERWGTDLSAAAIDLAARSAPQDNFVVANADRHLPWADGSFDVMTSIDARLNAAEFHRLLRPDGLLVVAVPAPDDLIELRERVLGAGHEKARADKVTESLNERFDLVERQSPRELRKLSPDVLRDLLLATYRGFRLRERERSAALGDLTVTLSHEVLAFRKKPPAGTS